MVVSSHYIYCIQLVGRLWGGETLKGAGGIDLSVGLQGISKKRESRKMISSQWWSFKSFPILYTSSIHPLHILYTSSIHPLYIRVKSEEKVMKTWFCSFRTFCMFAADLFFYWTEIVFGYIKDTLNGTGAFETKLKFRSHRVETGTFGPSLGWFTTHLAPCGKMFVLEPDAAANRGTYRSQLPKDIFFPRSVQSVWRGRIFNPKNKKKHHAVHTVTLTPAGFALVVRRAVAEPLLFLQSGKVQLVIIRHPEKIQVLLIGRQHLLSQSGERLGRRKGGDRKRREISRALIYQVVSSRYIITTIRTAPHIHLTSAMLWLVKALVSKKSIP